MLRSLPQSADSATRAIHELLRAHHEWFFVQDGRPPLAVNTNEFDFSIAHGRLIFSCWTQDGSRMWKVNAWQWTGEKLMLDASRRMGAEKSILELVPRASARAILAGIAAARQLRSEALAKLASVALDSARMEIASLSPGRRRDQPGRYARIVLRQPHQRIAVTATVAEADARNIDALFSAALLWFQRLHARGRPPFIEKLMPIQERGVTEAARQRHALLRDDLRGKIDLFEIDEAGREITPVRPLARSALWRKRLSRFPPVSADEEQGAPILAELPNAIDIVKSRHGRTLRYHGLPFARVRRVLDRERVWFGLEGSSRRLLDEHSRPDWEKLLTDLVTYRSHTCRDRQHWFYRAASEAWLESILRRDVSRLDPGLIIAPLHAQFRTAHGWPASARPIDLLALRQDGRLVVIELKVLEDREHVFQGVDYWRRVEAHRRRGHIAAARLFGDREISDESTLVYLAAPALRFHPTFATLARTIAPDVEIYRFDINEDWRAGVRVVRRERVNG